MNYFIASRWGNMKSVQFLTENLRSLGHDIFSYVNDSRNFVPKNELEQPAEVFQLGDDWRSRPALRAMYEKDMQGLAACDIMVLLLPAGETSHMEAGIAYGLSKHLVLIGEPVMVKSNYLMFHEWYKTIEDYITALRAGTSTKS
jgi:nucleoside 2-deoxyribosyltransferase